jgi:putative spermidine/putrescine transport system ATP-binding protein
LRVEIDRLLSHLGITSIYVTHDQSEAMALGDRIIVMEKGRIAQTGTPQEIYHHPATAFVADFIGTMNRIVRDGREFMFRPEDARIVPAGSHDLEAKVISSFFLGDHTRLAVDAGAAAPIIVETTERREWPRDETVYLAIAPGALLPVPGEAP